MDLEVGRQALSAGHGRERLEDHGVGRFGQEMDRAVGERDLGPSRVQAPATGESARHPRFLRRWWRPDVTPLVDQVIAHINTFHLPSTISPGVGLSVEHRERRFRYCNGIRRAVSNERNAGAAVFGEHAPRFARQNPLPRVALARGNAADTTGYTEVVARLGAPVLVIARLDLVRTVVGKIGGLQVGIAAVRRAHEHLQQCAHDRRVAAIDGQLTRDRVRTGRASSI